MIVGKRLTELNSLPREYVSGMAGGIGREVIAANSLVMQRPYGVREPQ